MIKKQLSGVDIIYWNLKLPQILYLIAMYVALSIFFYSHINLIVFINFSYTNFSTIYLFI